MDALGYRDVPSRRILDLGPGLESEVEVEVEVEEAKTGSSGRVRNLLCTLVDHGTLNLESTVSSRRISTVTSSCVRANVMYASFDFSILHLITSVLAFAL